MSVCTRRRLSFGPRSKSIRAINDPAEVVTLAEQAKTIEPRGTRLFRLRQSPQGPGHRLLPEEALRAACEGVGARC